MKTIIVTVENQDSFKELKQCRDIIVSENAKAEFPVLTTSGYIDLRENAKAEFPVLTTSGNIYLNENAKAEFPVLTTSGYIYLSENAKAEFPVLTTSGNIYLRENAKAEFQVLTTSGYIYLRENTKLITYKTNDLNYFSVDRTMFVCESEKTSKGIVIYSGYVLEKFINGKFQKKQCYVAKKDNLFAHGETLKNAIQDLQFKIVSEKIKNDPIYEDTLLTVDYYRQLTGACEFGCKSFMEQNGIKFTVSDGKLIEKSPIKAKDLLPLLEKSNAYGIEKFKSLINF